MGGRRLNWENVNKLRGRGPAHPIPGEIGNETKEWVISEKVEQLTESEAILYRQTDKYRQEISYCVNQLNKIGGQISSVSERLEEYQIALAKISTVLERTLQDIRDTKSLKKIAKKQAFLANEHARLSKNKKGYEDAEALLKKLCFTKEELKKRLEVAKENTRPFQEALDQELKRKIRREA